MFVFFFKQKTAYELRISDWSSDVCSSDLGVFSLRCVKSGGPDEGQHEGDPLPRIPAHPGGPAGGPAAEAGAVPAAIREGRPWRSDERRVGTECVSLGRSWGSAYH